MGIVKHAALRTRDTVLLEIPCADGKENKNCEKADRIVEEEKEEQNWTKFFDHNLLKILLAYELIKSAFWIVHIKYLFIAIENR